MPIRLPIASLLLLLVSAAAWPQDPPVTPAEGPASAKVADPMASFARMLPGEWRVTAQSGTSMFDTWHWGPGKHSMRVLTDGLDAAGNQWRELQAVYWHPGREQVCTLGLSPYARGVAEGTIKFEGETAEAVVDLYQTGVRRGLVVRWRFAGPDEYRESLLERIGPDLMPLAEWDHVRAKAVTARRPSNSDEAPEFPERLKALEALVGHTWEASGKLASGSVLHIQSKFEWVPYADGIYARVIAPSKDGEPRHLLDAYLYHHTGANALRCLALSRGGGVYEGDLAVLEGGALQLDLKGYEGDQVVLHVVRLDFEEDGALRHRMWSADGAERRLMLDARHKKLEPTKK